MTTASPIAPLLLTDGYKCDHRRQYPEGTQRVLSNYTNRGSRMPGVTEVVHFGLQAFCQRYLVEAFEPFFAAEEDEVAAQYEQAMDDYLGPNGIGTDHIRALHRLGYLPLRFCAVPEGTLVPLRVPSFTIENTLPEFFWLVNFIESELSAAIWHPSTVATIAYQYRKVLDRWAGKTSSAPEAVDFQLHDFSFRGQTSVESAGASAAGHLLSFKGSDALPALDWVRRYYPGDNGLVMASVPATEHSVMCAGGREHERDTYARLLDLYPAGVLSVVSDTWSLWDVIFKTLPTLKDKILARDGKLVIRPDSGDPADILCGTNTKRGVMHDASVKLRSDPKDASYFGVVELLWDLFGGTVNEAGYKELDSHIGAIYGDSINLDRAEEICARLAEKGFASTNVVFGVGSFSYQFTTRDTFGSAVKATWAQVDGVGHDLQKDPVTDSGLKKSAAGRLAVQRNEEGELYLIERATPDQEAASLLQPVWEDGKPIRTQSFQEVRDCLAAEAKAEVID